MSDVLLRVEHLKKYFDTPGGTLHAVDDVSFDLNRGKHSVLLVNLAAGSQPWEELSYVFMIPLKVLSILRTRRLPHSATRA